MLFHQIYSLLFVIKLKKCNLNCFFGLILNFKRCLKSKTKRKRNLNNQNEIHFAKTKCPVDKFRPSSLPLGKKYDVKNSRPKVNKLLIRAKRLAFFCFLRYNIYVGTYVNIEEYYVY